jgi:hypothetical protein
MPTAHSLLTIGSSYSKKDLSGIFHDDTISLVREGRYTLKPFNSVLLFVDLEKTEKEERFHFNDYFDDGFFHWDSQTTQNINTPTIQAIVHKRVEVNLFCRVLNKRKNVTQPFFYCGRLEYVDHDLNTANPVHIVFSAMDYDETTSNPNLLEIYSWRPEKIGKVSTNDNYAGVQRHKWKAGQKKPNYTERRGLVTSRVGQGYYRQEILKKWSNVCAITGCDIASILISSHIKRWSESTDEERLDPNNGVLLSPNVDALFDAYLISFTNEGELLVSKQLSGAQVSQLGIAHGSKLRVNREMTVYLEYHRSRFIELEEIAEQEQL